MTPTTAPSSSSPNPTDVPAATAAVATAAGAPAPLRRWHWAALAAVLILAVFTRVHGLTLNSLWIDELYSVEAAAGQCYADLRIPRDRIVDHPPHLTRLAGAPPTWRVWTTLDEDQHPPLYYVLLRLWRDAFGSSEAAMRTLSVLISIAGVALLFDLGRNLFGPAPALWACLIMALAQQQIWYAQEVRGYALMVTALIGACAAVVRIERFGFSARRAAALGGCLLAAMLTHYYAAAGCAAVGLYAVARLRGRALRLTLATCAVAAVAFGLAWGPFLLHQLHAIGPNSEWAADVGPGFGARWLRRLLAVPMRLLSPPSSNSATASWGIWLLLLVPLLLVRRRRALLLPLLVALFCIALPAAFDLARETGQLDQERYYLAAGPAIYLLAAGLLSDRRHALVRYALPASLALYCALSLPWTYIVHKADWRGIGRYASANLHDGDVVAFYSPGNGDRYSGVAYLAIDHFAPDAAPRTLFLDGRPLAPDVLARLRAAPAVWLFTDVNNPDLSAILPGYTTGQSYLGVAAGYLRRLVPPRAPPAAPPPPNRHGAS